MDTLKQLKEEFSEEFETTKKFLHVFPEGKNDYAPHNKSTKLLVLSTHLVDVFSWPRLMLSTSDLDLSSRDESGHLGSEKVESRTELEAQLEKNYRASLSALENATEKDLEPIWSISMSGQKLKEWTKYGAIRHALNQITHHRAQLGVYFRLLDIPLPASYGPSADDQTF